jgi:hypothetical protein
MSSSEPPLDNEKNKELDLDETTKKYGLEAGLLKAITSQDGDIKKDASKPKELLARSLL